MASTSVLTIKADTADAVAAIDQVTAALDMLAAALERTRALGITITAQMTADRET